MAIKLSDATLSNLPDDIGRPRYDRSQLRPGILHVGLGNFHRAHQAVYYDDLLNAGGDPAWGILGAGVMAADEQMRGDLLGQDCLYSVTEMSADSQSVRVVGSMAGFLEVQEGHAPILKAMKDPAVRIVSLTVTEGGYFVSAETGGFNSGHPAIRADITKPGSPATIFGAIVAGLRQRRADGERPFTVMSCDNLPHNGDVTRAAVLGVAREQDAGLAAWIDEKVTFPNGMVDRITPATTPERRDQLAGAVGIEDARPVFCEPFRQWVLEDRFANGRPDLEEAGVQFVDDVTPFEHMKIRMLNGGHAIIAYPSALLGIEFVHEAMADPLVSGFFNKVEKEEVFPVVLPVPGSTQEQYLELLHERFANPNIKDSIRRLCFDCSNRQPKFIVPSIQENLEAGRPVQGMALETALWCRYCFGVDDNGRAIEENDPSWDRLKAKAQAARETPDVWLQMRDIYGDIASHEGFREAFGTALKALHEQGTRAVLGSFLA